MNGTRSLGIGPVGAFMPGEDVMEPAPLVSREMLQAFGPSLLSRMREADTAQRQRWQAGERSPTPMTEDRAWLADDVAGSLLGPMGIMGAIKAYHGSPHRFDRFDMSKIGTGEGGTILGHGLHFSSDRNVAKKYGRNVYDVELDDSRILNLKGNIEDLSNDMRARLESAGVINSPVSSIVDGSRTTFLVGDKPVWIVEEAAPGRFKHFLGTGQSARPLPGSSVEEFEAAIRKEYPSGGPVEQILDRGQVSTHLAERLKKAGIGGIVDTDLSALSASGGTPGKRRDVFLVFDEDIIASEGRK